MSTKGQTFPPEPLSRAEVRALIGACGKRSVTGIRNRALLWTLYRGGLRISEALDLQPKDLNEPQLRVLHGKGDKPRTLALPPDAWAAVALWLERRRQLGVPRGCPLFCTISKGKLGKRLRHDYVSEALGRCRARAGIEKRVHCHGLRHTLASELVEEGTPMPLVQQVLGHADLGTTARYLQRIGATPRVVAAMSERAPLAS
jgi:site-specific recombinase XerD